MGAEIVAKSIKQKKKTLRKFIGRNVEKNAPEEAPTSAKKRGGVRGLGPKVPVRGKEFLRRLQAQGSLLANHHANNHPANK